MTRAKDISKILTDADLSGTLDVTGTVTAGGLTVEQSGNDVSVQFNNTNNDFTTATSSALRLSTTASDNNLYYGEIKVQENSADTSSTNMLFYPKVNQLAMKLNNNGDISFYEDTGTTPKLFWDASAEALGIGTSSPDDALHVNGNVFIEGSSPEITFETTGASNNNWQIAAQENVSNALEISVGSQDADASNDTFSPVAVFTSSGNVGINSSSPTGKFQVDGGRSYFSANSEPYAIYLRYNTSTGGVFLGSPSTDTFTVSRSGGAEHLRIDSSGNVGIGTSSPSFENGRGLEINYSGGLGSHLKLTDSASGSGGTNGFDLYAFNTSGYIENYESGSIVFRNNGSESMRISSGNLLVGSATNSTNSNLILTGATRWGVGTQSGGNIFYIVRDSDNVGQYMVNGSTSWTATSDERVKDIIEPITNAVEKVSSLRSVIGKYKADEETTRRVFLIAQDVQAVLPEAVNAQDDDIGTLGLQYTDIIPLLTAAIKEQQATITALEARIVALETA